MDVFPNFKVFQYLQYSKIIAGREGWIVFPVQIWILDVCCKLNSVALASQENNEWQKEEFLIMV